MLTFSEDFFRGEEREGFYVDETMKRYWAAQMEVLCEISRICDKYGLTYYAAGGTLLGTVRHKGWIPWDDDMDIVLRRQDYDKLIKVLPNELTGEYAFSSPLTQDGCDMMYTCIRNASTVTNDPERLSKFHGCPFYAAVDVFPIDLIPRDEELQKVFVSLLKLVGYGIALIREKRPQDEIEKCIKDIEENCDVEIDRKKTLVTQLWVLMNDLGRCVNPSEADLATYYPYFVMNHEFIYEKSCYKKALSMPFENMMINVPVGYDQLLRIEYGDYMIPMRGEQTHDYPSYKKQIELVREKLAEAEERYAQIEENRGK